MGGGTLGSLRFCSLASSSQYGNAYYIEVPGRARVLVDCGLSLRRLEAALAALGVDPSSVDAVFLTHEHADHVRALTIRVPFAQRYRIPVYAPSALWRAIGHRIGPLDTGLRRTIEPRATVFVGGPDGGGESGSGGAALAVTAFPKSHDAADPVGFVLSTPAERLGIVTDLGRADPAADAPLFGLLREAEHLVFESNHDTAMQQASNRPPQLKARVLGARGHLSNEQAGRALARLVSAATRTILLAHLSLDCNTPELAVRTVKGFLRGGAFAGRLTAAPPDRPSAVFGAEREVRPPLPV